MATSRIRQESSREWVAPVYSRAHHSRRFLWWRVPRQEPFIQVTPIQFQFPFHFPFSFPFDCPLLGGILGLLGYYLPFGTRRDLLLAAPGDFQVTFASFSPVSVKNPSSLAESMCGFSQRVPIHTKTSRTPIAPRSPRWFLQNPTESCMMSIIPTSFSSINVYFACICRLVQISEPTMREVVCQGPVFLVWQKPSCQGTPLRK